MGPLLPTELLQTLARSIPCRELQLRQLATLYNNSFAAPPVLVVYGLEATGKNTAVQGVLQARQIPFATVKCTECLSLRHVLSKIFVACVKATGQLEGDLPKQYDRVDSLNGLAVGLQKLLQNSGRRLVLVLDGIDGHHRGSSSTPMLLPMLARLGNVIPNLSVVFITSSQRPLHLQRAGVPHVYFPPYTRTELISLVTSHPPPDLAPKSSIASPTSSVDIPVLQKLHVHFAATVYDSLVGPTASTSLPVFRLTCAKLWPRFIWPYISGEPPPGKAKNWDFARLFVRNRALFQTEAEPVLVERLQPPDGAWTFEELEAAAAAATTSTASDKPLQAVATNAATTSKTPTLTTTTSVHPKPLLLKHFSALLLASSYLASHTSPKLDMLLFSQLSSNSKSHRVRKSYHRRKLFQSPSSSALAGTTTPTKPSTSIRASSSALDLNLNIPRPFTLERLLAIVRAIHPHGVPNRRSIADRVYRHLAELERLRLVVPASGGGGGATYDDEEKWRVCVGRERVEDMARQWGIGLSEFEVGGS